MPVEPIFTMAKARKRSGASSVIDPQEQPGGSAEQIGSSAGPGGERDDTADRRDRVALRAYELYLARGGSDGGDFDDWLAAERELVKAGHDSRDINGGGGRGDTGE